nr:immunoglobulin light chain junction region [Macaca mulatta]MOV65862.1 immunoglobulin light chain junction region [Macaca mulatta]MOV65917.1 immunoglobulin light chain junction region [Macaca mulatta]MOV65970.1 immunoglobulin light chain junction region [Macaca mulatta]MOV65976.1 immunoglobulin light chain junction region [Macaca mulatta]
DYYCQVYDSSANTLF